MCDFSDLVGKTLQSIRNVDDEQLFFETDDGDIFVLQHHQDCCESVFIKDISGDLIDILDTPILLAEESTDTGEGGEHGESYTWTFYKLRTIKGSVDISWLGTSNGYYSERVSFDRVN
jgi:hypothetical protein